MDFGDLVVFLVIVGIPLIKRIFKKQEPENSKRSKAKIEKIDLPVTDYSNKAVKQNKKEKIKHVIKDEKLKRFENRNKNVTENDIKGIKGIKKARKKGDYSKSFKPKKLFNRRELRKGIIFKEILGPPKSKKMNGLFKN